MADPTPAAGGDLGALIAQFQDLKRRISDMESPSGTQRYQSVPKLAAMIDDIQAQLDEWTSTRYTNGQINAALAGKANTADVVSKAGDSMSGDLFLPNSTAASSGYTVAYVNGDGRVARGASSERYKTDITPIAPDSLGDIWPDLHTFAMRDDPARVPRVGYIAERLAESEALRPFVVWRQEAVEVDGQVVYRIATDEDGNPIAESIDFIALLLAQVAQLNHRTRGASDGTN